MKEFILTPRQRELLTPRQWEAVAAVADGLSFKQVAERMGVSLATADNHIWRARTAIRVRNVAGLVSWYWAYKLDAANKRIAQLEAQLAHLKTFPRHD